MNEKIIYTLNDKTLKYCFSYNINKLICGNILYDDVLDNDKILERIITMGYNKNR